MGRDQVGVGEAGECGPRRVRVQLRHGRDLLGVERVAGDRGGAGDQPCVVVQRGELGLERGDHDRRHRDHAECGRKSVQRPSTAARASAST